MAAEKWEKAEGNAIFLRETETEIWNKVKKAKTDTGPTEPNQDKSPEIENIFMLLNLVSSKQTVQHFEDTYNNCTIRYGDLKKQLSDDIAIFTKPFREKIIELENNPMYINKIAKDGAEKARISARATLDGVQEIMGLKPIWK